MRELDDLRLERLLRDTLHAEADAIPVEVTASLVLNRWRVGRRRSSRRTFALLAAAAILLVPFGLLVQSGSRPAVLVGPSPSPRASVPPAVFEPADYSGWIAYSAGGAGPDPGYREVRLLRTDGSDDHAIQVPWTEPLDEADWARDGRSILLARERVAEGVLDILEFDLASGTSRELVHCDPKAAIPCAQTNEASYSADGRRIAYFFAEGAVDGQGIPADCGLRIMTIEGGAIEDVTRHPCGLVEDRHPRWSPDGTRLAFYRTQQEVKGGPVTGSALFIRDLATGAELQLTAWDASRAEELDWSPDGRWIVFMDGDLGDPTTGRLSRVRPDGTGLEVLATFGDGVAPFRPRYTFDGVWILVADLRGGPDSAGGHLFAVPADGGEPDEFLLEFPGNPFIYGTLQPTP